MLAFGAEEQTVNTARSGSSPLEPHVILRTFPEKI